MRCASASSRGRTRPRPRGRETCGRSFLCRVSDSCVTCSWFNWYVSRRWRRWSRTAGAVFFCPPPRSPGGVRDGPLRVGEASQRPREVSRHLCSGHIALGQRPPLPHPSIVQPGLRPVDPILESAQPPAACQSPQLPTSQKIGAARDPNKLLRETVSQRRDLPRRHSQPACPSSPSRRPGRHEVREASARAA